MKSLKPFFLGTILAVACSSVAQPQLAKDDPDLVLHYHFAGTGAFAGATNFARLSRILALTNSVTIKGDVLGRLAGSTAELFKTGKTSASQTKLLQPLWEDVLQAESVVDWHQTGTALSQFVFMIKLAEDRAKVWESNLKAVVSAWSAGEINESASGGWKAKLEAGDLHFSRLGKWVVIAVGAGDGILGGEWMNRVKSGEVPERFKEALEWFSAEINWPKLEQWLPGALGPLKPARMVVSLRMKNEDVRTEVSLRYPQAPDWQGQGLKLPVNTIGWPLFSLTGMHNLAAFLNEPETFRRLGYDPLAGDLFFWTQRDVVYQIFAMAQVADARGLIHKLAEKAPAVCNPKLRDWQWGELYWSTNENELRLAGVPAITPELRATNDAGRQFLYADLFPQSPAKESLPPGLLSQFEGKNDLVYFDWEITQFKIEQWRKIRNLLPLFPAPNQSAVPGAAAPAAMLMVDDMGPRLILEESWFADLSQLLGESVTEIRRVSPREFSFVRKSGCGFTSLELIYLAHWLTAPAFPFTGGLSKGAGDVSSPAAATRPPGIK